MARKSRTDPLLERRRLTDAELTAEARITEQDVADAIAAFNRYAPPEARGLLDARAEDEGTAA